MTDDFITLDRATKHYTGFTLDVTMRVPKDSITALVGVNGSGKTTTFRIILGLAKPDAGTGTLLGTDVTQLPNSVKRRVGAVLADSSFDAAFTGTDVIRQAKAFYPTFNATLCRTLLTRFSLPEDKPMSDFSTGMTAKFKTIIAMSHEPDVLILDEPTAGLDVVARNELLNLLRAYMETPGRAILISSHNSKDIETLCDDFYVIDRGRIRLHETIDRLRDDYAVLMLTDDQAAELDRTHILASARVRGGVHALTDARRYYEENMPGVAVARGDIDELITIMTADQDAARPTATESHNADAHSERNQS